MERISLSNAVFEGNSNAYLIAGEGETVLVDTGDWMDTTRNQLRAGLADQGVEFADIDHIFLTHWHPDHTGLAGEIQQASDATVHVHTADAPLVRGDPDAHAALEDTYSGYFDDWGVPADAQAELQEAFTSHEEQGASPTVTTFEDGATFAVGGADLRAVHASGHTAGLCLFEFDGGRQMIAGDALLPVYTPNVGGADVRVERPLEKYLRALRAIADAEYDRAWPGHRDPIDDPTERATEIIHHHEERSFRVLDALRRLGPCDIWTVSADLFGDLAEIHILHGPGECYAHVEHLEREGVVIADGDQYRLTDGVAADLVARVEEHWPLAF
jgi:glyoxylase-like metal-dependent hydrolase (beta-lactamase superfamily II)